jgi:beta-N-acetylhexosaminidase
MEAARQGGTLTEGATAALQAGCDMVLICNQPEEAEKVLDALRFTPSKESRRRIKRMRPRGKALEWSKLVADPQYLDAQTLLRNAFA